MTISSGLLEFRGVFTYREITTGVGRNGSRLRAERQAQDSENEQAIEGWHGVRVRRVLLCVTIVGVIR